ncbi:hypothetical protein M8J76_004594 [Diaphorina citri]|nr:hypothetical protein M8J75_000464 [Diaphorina citri]KAI5722162.1 hypothetical protein M8J76_004594 [Diaphorina citri]
MTTQLFRSYLTVLEQILPLVHPAVDKKKIHVLQPKAIKYYNKNMGGTDRLDQNVSRYRSNIRSKKWWWPLFAWLLHRKSCKSTNVPTLDLLDFRRAIAQVLMTKYATPRIRSGVVRSVVSGRVSSDARTNNSALEHILV